MKIEHYKSRKSSGGFARAIVGVGLAAALVIGGIALVVGWSGSLIGEIGAGAESLSPLERAGLRIYLTWNRESLLTAVSADKTAIAFAVNKGENLNAIVARLEKQKLVRDGEVLRRYIQYQGWDDTIEAGNFNLNAAMNVPAVAKTLTKATPNEVTVRVIEGWRLEQVAEALAAQPSLAVSKDEFLILARAGGRRGSFSFNGDIPATASYEGFLLPATYRFTPKADTSQVLDKLLGEFDKQFTGQMRSDAARKNLNVYQVITLASIVEREAVQDEERALIASVFLNRMKINMRLEADPTTQYGLATVANWWPPLNVDPRTVTHPFNTYVIAGLPPTPIANPSLKTINAVIYPADSKYIFFRAKCDGSRTHNFSVTYEEHLKYGCK